jgi:thiamine biosynthesis lipoprotein
MQYYSPDLVYHHILDPRIGISPTELASVTIVSENAVMSDALATAVMVLGMGAGLQLVEKLPGVEAFLVTKENRQEQSSGLMAL